MDDEEYDDDYFNKYLTPQQNPTIEAAPSLNIQALGSKEYGPSLPSIQPLNTLNAISASGAVPYPAGYQKPTQSLSSVLSAPQKKSSADSKSKPIYSVPEASKKKEKKVTMVRAAGGSTWEDPSLLDWDESDYRIFCGNLGNEVTDELLYKSFSKYKSLQKARVIRDKKTLKTKGFGFVSLKDPNDFLNAMKQMQGKNCVFDDIR